MSEIVLKDFYADWCMPCKLQNPILEELKKENPDIVIKKIDVDKDREQAMKYGVMSVPTLVLEIDGKQVARFVGVTQKTKLLEEIKKHG
jgi:thioredoxin 1